VLTLDPIDDRASVLVFSPDGTKLFTGFHRGSAIIWDVRRGKRASDTKK
jgi:WD40 repeat protein